MSQNYSKVVQTTRDYYNSGDADNFYFHIWGGKYIHIGLYHGNEDEIADASQRTVDRMDQMLPNLGNGSRVLDLGSGYGAASRYLASLYDCRVTALNLLA
jgi:cyclopropane fatty-acyl-phospholipid synthase-like methyltransferase